MTTSPTKDQADQFALMLESGMPSIEAIGYFVDAEIASDQALVKSIHDKWMRSGTVRSAILALQGKPWQGMDLMEKLRYSIDRHYAQMAYYLYTHNYSELTAAEKSKADTARQVLEAKLAGRAGKETPLEEFTRELLEGKLKLEKVGGRRPDQLVTMPTTLSN